MCDVHDHINGMKLFETLRQIKIYVCTRIRNIWQAISYLLDATVRC